MSEEVEETNSGVKKKGSWKEIAEFGEEVEEAIKEDVENKSFEDFEEWRPKTGEAENDMKKKTVDKALIQEKKLEKESEGVKEDFKGASEKVAEAGKKAVYKEPPAKEIAEASEEVAKPFYTKVAQAFRTLERLVYSKLALRSKRYYFDTEEFSADMKSRRDGDYELDVSFPTEEPREKVKEEFHTDNE
jgi:hypothetical protein